MQKERVVNISCCCIIGFFKFPEGASHEVILACDKGNKIKISEELGGN